MNILISLYVGKYYRELHLPAIKNSDYSFRLEHLLFGLKEDIVLKFENMNDVWSIKSSQDYQLELGKKSWKEIPLTSSSFINIRTNYGEEITSIVSVVDNLCYSYFKFDLNDIDEINIGKNSDNQIIYNFHNTVSRLHATIKKTEIGYKIVNHSQNETYVNANSVESEMDLQYGDVINVMGLYIVYLGDMIAIDMIRHEVILNAPILSLHNRNHFSTSLYHSKGKLLYHRAPRNYETLTQQVIEIEGPPEKNHNKKQSMLMMVGPSLTMAIPMIVGCMMMISASGDSGGSSLYMYSGLVMAVMSAVISVSWTLMNIRESKKEEVEYEAHRQEAYADYLTEKKDEIENIYQHSIDLLEETYLSAEDVINNPIAKGILWNRNKTHDDFLKHRIGRGDLPFQVEITIPPKKFELYKDELNEKPQFIKDNFNTLFHVPTTIDLYNNHIIGIVGGENKRGALEILKTLIGQIAVGNSYSDIKIGYFFNETLSVEKTIANAIRWLPHVWSEDKKTRYIAGNKEEASVAFYELVGILRKRVEDEAEADIPKPYYILFISDESLLERELIVKYLSMNDPSVGVTTIFLAEHYEDLPNSCQYIIENTDEFKGCFDPSIGRKSNSQKIDFDQLSIDKLELFARELSHIEVNEEEVGGEIPNAITFFEMMNILQPSDLDVVDNWAKNRTYENIRGLIGEKAGGTPCYLDVHEKYHGPHGLVAGTTGSGKSETLQTYMLSLAINYSPDDIGYFIIDYKGGGMANLFNGLPHLVGSISNLSGAQIARAMISIKSENKRRQRIFNEYDVNNINSYTKLYKNGEAKEPIPHLFIIVDEFAELKREQPEFMNELISVAQVGRSLGVHLILATQKPSGTVDDNIWSNAKFRLCLRVQDRQDSMDMLHKPDAAYITQAGRCYLQVGNDEVYELFQSGYSGAMYDEDLLSSGQDIVKEIGLNGKVTMKSYSLKQKRKKDSKKLWIEQLLTLYHECYVEKKTDIEILYPILEKKDLKYAKSKYNTERLNDLKHLYLEVNIPDIDQQADTIIQMASEKAIKLPELKEQTQLDAIKDYLAIIAKENGYTHQMSLWLPIMSDHIYLAELQDFYSSHDQNDLQHLYALIGKMDDPANQLQMSYGIDFFNDGHIGIIGQIASGKSTLMQTMAYSLISHYSSERVHIYALDFSSKMMNAFEDAPQFGAVLYENDVEKIKHFFAMIKCKLEERKTMFHGGDYKSYIRSKNISIPAIIIMIDNFAEFSQKTEENYTELLTQLVKEGLSNGIYFVISDIGFGMDAIPSRIAENLKTMLTLSMADQYSYAEYLHVNRVDIVPEANIKGRGLANYEGNILEYQTALALEAHDDFDRNDKIRNYTLKLKAEWIGDKAEEIPTIPKSPTFNDFSENIQYQSYITKKDLFPIGYDTDSASIYTINLRKTYCFGVYGNNDTGKTNFLKACIKVALEKKGQVVIIGEKKGQLVTITENNMLNILSDKEELFMYFKELMSEFIARNEVKNALINEGKNEDEIFNVQASRQAIFIFIENMNIFLKTVYEAIGEYNMSGFIKNVMDKGFLHNIYFIARMSNDDEYENKGYDIFDQFVKYKTGIHFGGHVDENEYLDFSAMPYDLQERTENKGVGLIPGSEDTARVMIPLVRKVDET